jgi:hypothetical protein
MHAQVFAAVFSTRGIGQSLPHRSRNSSASDVNKEVSLFEQGMQKGLFASMQKGLFASRAPWCTMLGSEHPGHPHA